MIYLIYIFYVKGADTMNKNGTYNMKAMSLKVTKDNHEYLSDIAWWNRTTMSNYINDLIEKDRAEQIKNGVYPVNR